MEAPPGGGLYLEIAIKYKVKQSKNGKFPSNYKNSLNFIRLLRVVITPSVVERRKRLEAIG